MANKKLEQSNMKPLMILEEKKVLITMQSTKKEVNKGAWTREEDQKLAEVIAVHGAKKWKTIATIAGLNRCGKSCRLRWLNYLRPNIKRGNISDQEEDLILRLHKLLGNRWSLIAGRLPGRTDNEIKNYWNSHLSKRISQNKDQIKQSGTSSKKNNIIIRSSQGSRRRINKFHDHLQVTKEENIDFNNNNNNNNNNINIVSRGSNSSADHDQDSNCSSTSDFDVNDFFDFSTEGPTNLEWMSRFLDRGGSF